MFALTLALFVALVVAIVIVHRSTADAELYRRRWQEALQLLTDADSLEDAQAKYEQLRRPPRPTPGHQHPPFGKSAGDMKMLREMTSFDRAKLELKRARMGLPRVDDLEGMSSYDKARVLRAHMDNETRDYQGLHD